MKSKLIEIHLKLTEAEIQMLFKAVGIALNIREQMLNRGLAPCEEAEYDVLTLNSLLHHLEEGCSDAHNSSKKLN